MEKPITVKVKDLKSDMVSLINNSGLPLFIVEPIVRDILSAVETKAEQQYRNDRAAYEASMNNTTSEEEENHD